LREGEALGSEDLKQEDADFVIRWGENLNQGFTA
jgi:hypothetical protein